MLIDDSYSDPEMDQKGRIIRNTVDTYLQETLSGLVHCEFGIVDFVKLVYNFEPQHIPKRDRFTLLETSCMSFCNAGDEFESYKPLEEIIEDLKGQLLADIQPAPLVLNVSACGHSSPRDDYDSLTPDFFLGTRRAKNWTHQCWTTGLGYGEVKRSEGGRGGTRKMKYTNYRIDLDVLMRVSIDELFVYKTSY